MGEFADQEVGEPGKGGGRLKISQPGRPPSGLPRALPRCLARHPTRTLAGLEGEWKRVVDKMDLTEFRYYTLNGVGLGGLAASDGMGWVNVLDGLPQSGHGSTSQAGMHSTLPCSLSMACST